MVDTVRWIRRHLTLIRTVSGLVILLATAGGVLFRILPLTVAALLVAALPGMLSVDIPYGRGPGRYTLNAGLLAVSAAALAVVLWLRHSDLPIPALLFVAAYCCWEVVAMTFDLVFVWNSSLRQRVYERRLKSEHREQTHDS
jgi:hypothetical protein